MLLKKLIFPHSRKFFPICRISTFKVYAEGKIFADYSLIIVVEIYIIFGSELIRQTNSGLYSLGTDGSNDESGIEKLNPVLICLFVDNKGKVYVQLLDMGAFFNNIDSILRNNKVDWENCVTVGLDITVVNVGKKISIMTRVLVKNNNVSINGCPC